MSDQWVIECRKVTKTYQEGRTELTVFQDISLELKAGETLAIVGSSGAGKTTLLNLLGGLDKPSSGEVLVAGKDINRLRERARAQFRNASLGFVYQFHHLLPEFSALENVAMPCLLGGRPVSESRELARQMLDRVGLSPRLTHKPSALSGGERQRVAIARALVNEPRCVLMDEPTGNLDETTARKVQALIRDLSEHFATAFVVVTHDRTLATRMGRVVRLEEGRLIAESQPEGNEEQAP